MDVVETALSSCKNKTMIDKKKETSPVKLPSLEEITSLKDDFFALDRSKMMVKMFEKHGRFCASHPWEVIFVTLTFVVCTTSMTFGGPLHENSQSTVLHSNPKTSDVVILSITRCLAVAYIYLQFMKLRNLGSKYLLGITGILTIFFSFGFSAAVINFLGADLNGLGEAMPVFLLLVDLSKACTLAKFALSSKCQDEIVSNIGQGMALVGPMLTLDTLVEALVIGVGTLSGVRTLQVMCCFGCLSVVANYFAFMTFYPSCLAIVLELTRDNRRLVQIQQLAKVWQLDDESQKPNPVTQKVKIIMSAGLVFVHIHSRMISPNISPESSPFFGNSLVIATDQLLSSSVPVDESANLQNNFSFWQTSGFTIDYLMALVLVVILGFKYVVFDTDYASQFIKKEVGFVDQLTNNNSSNTDRKSFVKFRKSVVIGDDYDKVILEQDFIANGNESKEKRNRNLNFLERNSEVDTDSISKESLWNKNSKFYVESDSSDEDNEDIKGNSQVDVTTQTCDTVEVDSDGNDTFSGKIKIKRSIEECVEILKSDAGPKELSDDEVMQLVSSKHIPAYKLENILGDHERGVSIRRKICSKSLTNPSSLNNLPFLNFDYNLVDGACCENVIGYMPVPVGVAGPLLINGKRYMIPMATTEGCLVASTNRGCRAVSYGQGITSRVINNGMTRAPVVKFSCCGRASDVKAWLEDKENFDVVAESFNSTSRFARLKKLQVFQIARSLYIRFVATTGDAMGMNMLSKGCEKSLLMLQESYFNDMEILSLSGNFCTDKKPSAINWIEGRGKSVVCEAIVSASVIRDVLKSDVTSLVHLNLHKNLVGSVAAGSIGGFNAHAANIVTAIYIATGQDPAQNVCSSNCITIMEKHGDEDLYISCTMPSIEVGTVGGGTVLLPQAACLDMMGVRGSNEADPGANAATLANIVCSAVLAGELSLMAALAAGHLVKSHLKHNRSVVNIAQPSCTTH